MAGPELVVKVGANIEGLRTGMAQAAAAVKTLDTTAQTVGTTLRGTGTAADHAAAKLRYLGDAGDTATPKVNNLRGALGQFDGVLAAMGIKLGPEIRALGELGDVSGKTTGQVGKLATAGLVVGALMAGWKIGRVAADFFDLDTKIGNATAKLLGWGDVGAEVAGAKQDTINKAIRDGASATISYTEAIAFNIATQKEKAGALTVVTTKTAAQTAADRVAAEVEKAASAVIQENNRRKLRDLQDQMAANKAARDLEAASLLALTKLQEDYTLTRVKQSGTANAIEIADIQKKYAVLTAELTKSGRLTEEISAQIAANMAQDVAGVGIAWDVFKTKSIPALQETEANARKMYDAMARSGMFLREDVEAQRQKWEQARDAARGYGDTAVTAEQSSEAATEKANKALDEKNRLLERAKNLEKGGSSELRDLTKKQFTEAGGENRIAMLENSTKDRAAYGPTYEGMLAFMRDQVLLAELKKFAAMPKYADGVTDAPGGWSMVGERGPERMFVPPHANIYPTGSGAGGSSVTNIYITQPLGTPQQIYAVIDKVITDRQKQIGTRF